MIGYKYKVRFTLHEKMLYLKLRYLHVWLKKVKKLRYFVHKKKVNLVTLLKSPHVNKKSREQITSSVIRFFYFFQTRDGVKNFLSFLMYFFISVEYFGRAVWYQKQGLFYSK